MTAATSLAELITPMTVAEASETIYAALAARGVKTTGWKPGAVVRTIVAALAIILAAFSRMQAAIAKSGFLDTAEGAWLTLLAFYVYSVTRDEGSFATGVVTCVNSTGSIYSGDPGDLVFINTASGKTYRNTEVFTIGSMSTVDIAIEAIEIGSDSTSLAGEIDDLVTTLNGVSVSNAADVIGSDAESDALLRLRCRESLGILSPNGPRDAYAYVARTTKRLVGSSIGVTRCVVIPDGYGNVDVYLATASGGVTGTVGDTSTDLGVIDEAIQLQVVPEAVTATVQSATSLTVAVTYELWVRDTIGLTATQVEDAVNDALSAAISDVPIGGEVIAPAAGKVYIDTLEAAIDGALPAGSIVKRTITVPAADVAVATNEAPVAGTMTATAIHFVPRRIV